jgi:hypothetical protein
MAARKVTFTLDSATVHLIEDAASRLAKSKSQVVREAVADYHARIGRLSEAERRRMLQVFDTLVPRIPPRPQSDLDAELKQIRHARRSGGRVTRAKKP